MKIALYDIDFTLLPFDSFNRLVGKLLRKKPLNLLKLPVLILSGLLTVMRLRTLTQFKSDWLSLADFMDDRLLEDFSREYVKDELIPSLKPGVKEHIEKFKSRGYSIVFATASFEFYLKYFAEELGANYFFGTRTESARGKRHIQGTNCKGQEKIRRIQQVIPLTDIDKELSVSFSDSMSDYPFTECSDSFSIVHKHAWTIKSVYVQDVNENV